jgi:CheY-like chemotaxis protein
VASTILYVEDDLALAAIVKLVFHGLGFAGKTLTAPTVAAAEKLLEDRARERAAIDLIISDMHLPDGLGLDLVRAVRASPTWHLTPMLILSGDLDPKKVGRAYALGANAYVDKSPPGRTFNAVVAALYEHWARDVIVVPSQGQSTLQQTIARTIAIRGRYAQIFQKLTNMFADNSSESAFWLSRALTESNLQNLLGFLKNQLGERALPGIVADRLEIVARDTELQLSEMEARLARGPVTREEAYRYVIDLFAVVDFHMVADSIGDLFPVSPVAVAAIRDFLFGALNDTTTWVEIHTVDPILRQRAGDLRMVAGASLVAELSTKN